MRRQRTGLPEWLWRTSATLLLGLFAALLVAPLASPQWLTEATLPICCRTHGRHQCTAMAKTMAGTSMQASMQTAGQTSMQDSGQTSMQTAGQTAGRTGEHSAPALGRLFARCPFSPAAPTANHAGALRPPQAALLFAEIVAHPALHAQTEARGRIAFDRSRQKRGPPAQLLSV